MKLALTLLLSLGLLLSSSRPADAQFLQLTVSGSPATLTINSVVLPGQQPASKVNATTTYRVLVFLSTPKKITASLNAAMPAGVTLTALFAAPAGATSNGAVALDLTTRDLVTNINNVFSTNAITYTLSATVLAGVIPLQSRTVTLTLVNFP